jgi:hypothetical protein
MTMACTINCLLRKLLLIMAVKEVNFIVMTSDNYLVYVLLCGHEDSIGCIPINLA